MGKLQNEIKQQKPFAGTWEEAYLNLVRTADMLSYESGELLRGSNLTPSSYNVLRILRGAGEDGLPSGEIGNRMLTRMPDITRVVDRLQEMELVERYRPPHDRRVVRARVTKQGLTLLKKLDTPMAELHRAQMQPLSPQELTELIRLLECLRESECSRQNP